MIGELRREAVESLSAAREARAEGQYYRALEEIRIAVDRIDRAHDVAQSEGSDFLAGIRNQRQNVHRVRDEILEESGEAVDPVDLADLPSSIADAREAARETDTRERLDECRLALQFHADRAALQGDQDRRNRVEDLVSRWEEAAREADGYAIDRETWRDRDPPGDDSDPDDAIDPGTGGPDRRDGGDSAGEDADSTDGDSDSTDEDAAVFESVFADRCDAIADPTPVRSGGPLLEYRADLADGPDGCSVLTLADDYADRSDAADAFLAKARQWRGIAENPGIAPVHRIAEMPRPWIAFGFGAGGARSVRARLDDAERLSVIESVGEALRTAGLYNVQHFSVRPEAVAVTDAAEATLTHWGIERRVRLAVDEPRVTPFTAPEQLPDSDTGVGDHTTVYRYGAFAFWLLSGRPPFESGPDLAAAIRSGDRVPLAFDGDGSAVEPALERALSPDPAERHASAYELRSALRTALR